MKKKIKDSLGDLKGKVVTADKVAVKPFKEGGTMLDDMVFDKVAIEKQIERLKTLEVVEEFCNSNGITAIELTEGYKSKAKGKKVATIEEKEATNTKPSKSNWRKDFIKAKTGYSPTD